MKTEKHIIKGHFKGKRPHVKVTVYELSAVDCSADKMSGYYSQEATLISDDPEPGYDFAGWSVTGSNVTGNNVRFEGDITAKANYSAHKYNVTLQNDGHGSIAANKTTGNIGDTITLSNTPNAGYGFSGYSITGATLTSNQFNIGTNDVTAKGWFSALPTYTLTLQNDGHGTINATKLTGRPGDTVTLSNNHNRYYRFKNYTQTGGSLNGSTFTFGSQNATVKAWFSANKFTVSGHFAIRTTSKNTAFYGPYIDYKTNNTPNTIDASHYWSANNNNSSYNFNYNISLKYSYIRGDGEGVTAQAYVGSASPSAKKATSIKQLTGWVTVYNSPRTLSITTATNKTGYPYLYEYHYNGYVNMAFTKNTWSATGYAP